VTLPPSHASLLLAPRLAGAVRRALVPALVSALVVLAGCDRIKRQLDRETDPTANVDGDWQVDSTFLASKPGIVFRVLDHAKGRVVAPIATFGKQGFRRFRLRPRAWRAFDLQYLQAGSTLHAVSGGRAGADVKMTRGMWESVGALDTMPQGCSVVPIGVADASADTKLVIANDAPKPKAVSPLSAGELEAALANVPTLIAPSSGIGTSMLGRYKREVHQVPSGISDRPSIIVTYDDPEQVPDTLRPIAQRPRQFIVILDKGVYGYRSSYTYTTLGNALTPPRLRFVDFLDVDGDGKSELFFGFTIKVGGRLFDATQVMRFENDSWREVMREIVRCQ
jgi:hypothetical protein